MTSSIIHVEQQHPIMGLIPEGYNIGETGQSLPEITVSLRSSITDYSTRMVDDTMHTGLEHIGP